MVFVALLAIAYALGRRSARNYYIAQGLLKIVETTAPSPAPLPPDRTGEEAPAATLTSGYAVQLITYEKPKWTDQAKKLVNTLRAQGYPSFASELKDHIVVYVGLFATREEAEKHEETFRTYKVNGQEPFRDCRAVPIKLKQ